MLLTQWKNKNKPATATHLVHNYETPVGNTREIHFFLQTCFHSDREFQISFTQLYVRPS